MISLTKIKSQARRIWDSQHLQRSYLSEESIFPLIFPLPRFSAKVLQQDFSALRSWIREITENNKEHLGYGYQVVFKEVTHRQLGQQLLPIEISFPNQDDFLHFLDKKKDFQKFCNLVEFIIEKQPSLKQWLLQNTKHVLLFEDKWPKLLDICEFMHHHPQPSCYLRELGIPDVDSKFIEQHKTILSDLFDQILLSHQIRHEIGAKGAYYFEQRYGFKHDEALIRFRILDKSIFNHISDISIPLSEFKNMTLPYKKIYITENKTNGLTFPLLNDAIVVFGLGYGIQMLQAISWLSKKEIIYWGDIDTHGFAILSQMRGYYPQTQSILMDIDTLQEFKKLWVQEHPDKRFLGPLQHLTDTEQVVFLGLINNIWGENLRLEQERIDFQYACHRLKKLDPSDG